MNTLKSMLIAVTGFMIYPLAHAGTDFESYQLGAYNKAFQSLQSISNQSALANYDLARMYLYGYGVLRSDELALRYFKTAADKGHLQAQLYLARYALQHEKNAEEALKWFKMAAQQDNLDAQVYVVGAYLNGYGSRKSPDKARHYFIEASKAGNPIAQYELAEHFLASRHASSRRLGLIWMKKSATEGNNPKAQLALGEIYATGKHVRKDKAEAESWYQKAAAQNYPPAMKALADWYEKEGNKEQAENLMKKVAGMGAEDPAKEDSRVALALWLSNGKSKSMDLPAYQLTGIYSPWKNKDALSVNRYNASPQIKVLPRKTFFKPKFEVVEPNEIPLSVYYNALASHEKWRAQSDWRYPVYPLSRHLHAQLVANSSVARYHERALPYEDVYPLEKEGDIDQGVFTLFFENDKDSQNYLMIFNEMFDSAILGNAQAQFHIGQMFQYGLGVTKSDFMAISFYGKAASQQHLPSQYEMAKIYLNKDNDPEAYLKGFKYLRDAAFKGNANAQYVMSKLLQSKNPGQYIVKVDDDQALSMMYLSAANGFGQAQYELAERLFYDQNRSLSTKKQQKMRAEVRKLYESAANQGVVDALLPLAFFNAMENDKAMQKRAFDIAHEQALAGNEKAALLLGLLYDRGIGVQADAKEAMGWYQKSGNNPISQFIIGTYMSEGKHIAQDKEKAERLLRMASHADFSYADLNLAILSKEAGHPFFDQLVQAYDSGNSKAGILLADYTLASSQNDQSVQQAQLIYQGLADQGDAEAQLKLGYIYEKGIGLSASLEQAKNWYQKAVDQGNPYAAYQLAMLYQTGLLSHPDSAKALQLFQQAASRLAVAKLAEGFVYETSFDNYPAAFKAYQEAAKQGESLANYNLGLVYQYGKGQPVNYRLAGEYYQKAAEAKVAVAMSQLADLYLNGQGQKLDVTQALQWYENAAASGNSDALYHLGLLYEAGIGKEIDYAKAIAFYQQALEQGNEKAMIALARLYQYGIGTPQNLEAATALYQKLSARNNAYAQFQLAKMALNSDEQDAQSQAKQLLKLAIANGSQQANLLMHSLTAKTEGKLSYIEPACISLLPQMQGQAANRMYLEAIVEWNRGDETLSRLMLKRIISDYPQFKPAQQIYRQINSRA